MRMNSNNSTHSFKLPIDTDLEFTMPYFVTKENNARTFQS